MPLHNSTSPSLNNMVICLPTLWVKQMKSPANHALDSITCYEINHLCSELVPAIIIHQWKDLQWHSLNLSHMPIKPHKETTHQTNQWRRWLSSSRGKCPSSRNLIRAAKKTYLLLKFVPVVDFPGTRVLIPFHFHFGLSIPFNTSFSIHLQSIPLCSIISNQALATYFISISLPLFENHYTGQVCVFSLQFPFPRLFSRTYVYYSSTCPLFIIIAKNYSTNYVEDFSKGRFAPSAGTGSPVDKTGQRLESKTSRLINNQNSVYLHYLMDKTSYLSTTVF